MNSYKLHLQKQSQKGLTTISDRGWTNIFDWTPNAWQAHAAYNSGESSILANPTVFACVTLIQGDIGKLPFVVQQEKDNIWVRTDHAVLKLLKKPNLYQNQIQFRKNWISSKLLYGNTYVLKVRDGRDIVGLIILDPARVTPLVSDMGEVFYQLTDDRLSMIEGSVTVPASEIIHDRDNCLYHPLVGLSPLYAGLSAARVGSSIIDDSKTFFGNGAKPSGILTAPGSIADETAKRLKDYWGANFTGDNAGRVAVVGDGLKYEPMRMTSVDSQTIEQLGWSDEKVCSVFHVPPYMVNVGQMPTYNNIEALTISYYSQCLQDLMESMEECLNQGLSIQGRFRIQLDLEGLFRMDSESRIRMLGEGVKSSIMAPNEARKLLNLPPLKGGESVYLQQQNYSLEALAERDAANPLAAPEPAPAPPPEPPQEMTEEERGLMALLFEKELRVEH